jgi:pyruvate/2-oxoglutarate dehydrogenase complex dihydrolipoamide acyltransferase (E2) component
MNDFPVTEVVEPGEGRCLVRHGERIALIHPSAWVPVEALATLLAARVSRGLTPKAKVTPPAVPVETPTPKLNRATAPAKVAAKQRRQAGSPAKRSWTRADTASTARARKLVERQGFSLKRAAAAVEINYATLWAIAKREEWDVPKQGAAPTPSPAAPVEKAPRSTVRCQNCTRRTEVTPCRHCFEKVPELMRQG